MNRSNTTTQQRRIKKNLTMRFTRGALLSVPWLALSWAPSMMHVDAFTVRQQSLNRNDCHFLRLERTQTWASSFSPDGDCGCGAEPTEIATIYSGKRSDKAMEVTDIRAAIRDRTFYTVNGESLTMDDIIGHPTDDSRVSVVVLLRSLGWFWCQELVLQWSKRLDELEAKGITLAMISIGKPEVGTCCPRRL